MLPSAVAPYCSTYFFSLYVSRSYSHICYRLYSCITNGERREYILNSILMMSRDPSSSSSPSSSSEGFKMSPSFHSIRHKLLSSHDRNAVHALVHVFLPRWRFKLSLLEWKIELPSVFRHLPGIGEIYRKNDWIRFLQVQVVRVHNHRTRTTHTHFQ